VSAAVDRPLGNDAPPPAPPAPSAAAAAPIARPFAFGDAPTADLADDALGFVPYVGAVRDFLMHPQTETPLTMSVEGEWGSGKSSFLLQLRQALSQAKAKTIFFNAWRHNKDESLWATFALECISQLRAQQKWNQRVVSSVMLAVDRLDWSAALPSVLRFLARLAVLLIATAVVIWLLAGGGASKLATAAAKDGEPFLTLLFGAGGIAGWVLVLAIVQKKLREAFGDPFEIQLLQYVQDPGYKSRVDFVETFHEDFARITCRFAGGSKVFILIDDLDRCDVPKVADLTQTINQLTSTDVGKHGAREQPHATADDAKLIFIIGMDRELVAASLAARYEPLLPYLTLSASERGSTLAQRGIDYGYAFMEKLIQLPFRVPIATAERLSNLELDKKDVERETLADLPQWHTNVKDSERLRALVQEVEFVFDHNPRRIKQFVNLLRLQVHIGIKTQMLEVGKEYTDQTPPHPTDVTVEKLGKFLALVLRWPRFVEALTQEKTLLKDLQRRACAPGTECGKLALQWIEAEPAILTLLGVMRDRFYPKERFSLDTRTAIFSLENLDVNQLLNVAPTGGSRPTPADPRVEDPETDLVVREFVPAGVPCLVQHAYEGHDLTLHLLVPNKNRGLGHFFREGSASHARWKPHKLLAKDDMFHAVSLIQSDFDNGNLEMVARFGEKLSHFWRFAEDNAKWRGPYDLFFKGRGRTSLIQDRSMSHRTSHGNFEFAIGLLPAGLAHWWRDNSEVFRQWNGPHVMSSSATAEVIGLFPAALPEDLIAVVFDLGRLTTIERRNHKWGSTVDTGARFVTAPAVLQRSGRPREFDVIYVADSRLMQSVLHYDNRQLGKPAEIFAPLTDVEAVTAASTGGERVDVVVLAKQRLHHFLHLKADDSWQGPFDVLKQAGAEHGAPSPPPAV
jgi:hypothetical protein